MNGDQTSPIPVPALARMQRESVRGSNSGTTGFHALPSEALEKLEEMLEKLTDASRARCSLVLDRTGLILSGCGDFHPLNPAVMGATAAGVVAALNSMVARSASPEVSVRIYGAEVEKIHFVLLGERLILCLLLGRLTTSGQMRQAVKEFLNEVNPLLDRYRPDQQQGASVLQSVMYIETKLDEMFKDFK